MSTTFIYTRCMFGQAIEMSVLDDLLAELPPKLTVDQVAALLNISEKMVRRLLTTGPDPMPGFKIGAGWLIFRDELRPWLMRRHSAPSE